MAFCVWYLSLSITFSRILSVAACANVVSISFLLWQITLHGADGFHLACPFISSWTFGLVPSFATANRDPLDKYLCAQFSGGPPSLAE